MKEQERRYGRRYIAQRVAVVFALSLGVVLALTACSNQSLQGERKQNQAPHVWLSSAPPEGNSVTYRLHLYWGGWDPDGEIAYYEYAITNNTTGIFDPADTTGSDKWHRVDANDSTFTFSADEPADTTNTTNPVSRFQRSHTFFIRAVDEEGLASREPAYRSFTAWTLSPTVIVTVPHITSAGKLSPAIVPPITTFQWKATDYVNTTQETQDPDSVRYILHAVEGSDYIGALDYIRKNPNSSEWSPWEFYRAPGDSGKSWTTPPVDYGSYVFAVQAKDEAGAVTPVFDESFNARRVRVSARSTGPLLDVTNEYIGTVRTSVVNTPAVIVDMPAGVPLQFNWGANADSYGGIVSGYRYGWDIADLNDPEQWEVDYTPFTSSRASSPPRRFFFGTHTFDIEVIDNSGSRSRIEVKVNIVQFSMGRDLLLVDDFYENPAGSGIDATNGELPNDQEHDQFWRDVLADVPGFNPSQDVIQVRAGDPISISRFADYKAVIWDTYAGYAMAAGSRPKLYDLIQFRSKNPAKATVSSGTKIQPNLLALFLRAGGHLLLCGSQPLTQVINTGFFSGPIKFPLIFKYELEGDQDGNYSDQIQNGPVVGDQSFAYEDACVNVLDITATTFSNLRRNAQNGCGVELIRRIDLKDDGLRSCLPLDPSFPRLDLRPEVAAMGKAYAPDRKGLNAELYNPPYFNSCVLGETKNQRPCFEPIYGNGCLDTGSPIYNAPVAFWTSAYADVVPESGGTGARSMVMAVEPYYFAPASVKTMVEHVLRDEWKLY